MTLVVTVVLVVLVGPVVRLASRWMDRLWRRGKRGSMCGWCGQPVPARRVHTIHDRPADELEAEFAAWGGGSAVSQDRCGEHCDGSCGRRHWRRAKLSV